MIRVHLKLVGRGCPHSEIAPGRSGLDRLLVAQSRNACLVQLIPNAPKSYPQWTALKPLRKHLYSGNPFVAAALVDDEPDVLSASKLAIQDFTVYGLPVKINMAVSKAEALAFLC